MNTEAAESAPPRPATTAVPLPVWVALFLGLYLFGVTAGAGFGAYSTWPSTSPQPQPIEPAAGAAEPSAEQLLAQAQAALDAAELRRAADHKENRQKEMNLVRFVLYLGILGACLHAMTSMATYVGNRTFQKSWVIWYLLRPLMGGVLAWLVFLVFRGGFLGGADVDVMNPYAFGALGGLSGLFSKRVIDKLGELIDTLFRMAPGKGDDARANKAIATALSISAVAPDKLSEAQEKTTLTITGAGFTARTQVEVDGMPLKPRTSDATQLTVDVPVEAYTGRKRVDLLVRAGGAEGAASNVISLTVTP
jgi:hypothetical protein